MPIADARLRIHHPCPYCGVSVAFPRTLLLLWCDNRRDVFLLSAPEPDELRRVIADLRLSFHARVLTSDGNEALVEVPDFEWSTPPSVTALARRCRVWVLHPVVYYGGTETYRLVAPSRVELNRLVARLRRVGAVEILSLTGRGTLGAVRDLPTASIHFFEGLTDRQARCLVAAYEGGLLDVPARAKWGEVARRQQLSRSTFGEHLRKGQLRLLANSYPALKARTAPRGAPTLVLGDEGRRKNRRLPLQGVRRE